MLGMLLHIYKGMREMEAVPAVAMQERSELVHRVISFIVYLNC